MRSVLGILEYPLTGRTVRDRVLIMVSKLTIFTGPCTFLKGYCVCVHACWCDDLFMCVNLVEEVRLSVRMCTHMHTHTNTHTPHTLAFPLIVFSLLLLLMILSQDLSTLHYLVMSRAIFVWIC